MRYIFFIYFHQNLGTVRAASRTSEDVPSSSTTTISRDTPIPQPQVSKKMQGELCVTWPNSQNQEKYEI